MEEWKGCELEKCPYGKEYGDCDTCIHLITKTDIDKISDVQSEEKTK